MLRCDNQSVAHLSNSQTSKSAEVMVWVRAMTLKCLQLILTVRAEHISGYYNGIAYSISHLQFARFQELAPEAEQIQRVCQIISGKTWESELGSYCEQGLHPAQGQYILYIVMLSISLACSESLTSSDSPCQSQLNR